MLRRLLRALPVLTLGLGSWVGVSGQGPCTPKAFAPRSDATLRAGDLSRTRPPVDVATTPVTASMLPDPTPWPQLNPTASVNRAWLLAEGPVPRPGSGRRLVTFTFDDGPFPETTPVVLHVLAKHQVRATFFWIGRYLDGNGERAIATRKTAQEVRDAGHLIGNHTHDHARLTVLSRAEALAQMDDGAGSIQRAVGIKPCLFRPPFGQLDDFTESVVREQGLTVVLWNIEVGDLLRDDAAGMAESLESQIDFSGGGIVLLHDIRFSTADALDKVLTWLDKHRYDPSRPSAVGYDVVDFVEFMRETAASPQPYPNRSALEEARAAAWRKAHARAALPTLPSPEGLETM
jgi:peptidoglycan/xylan/chitin deacetylase (PgdA/CDA1 family)